MACRIDFSPEADDHIAALSAFERARLLDEIAIQLIEQPSVETRRRKRMRPNPVAQYRLRVGNLRVYYDVDEAEGRVLVKAVGVKVRDKVYVGRKEIDL
ncbi:MAG TPA: type II toxin-antitoxin system RelE/ParE family toxin [Vicinamibacteria bacterium]|nr:type II toxin-antitoxin system RelE/ParE family toxin [Vicinamibacteria bacterium]